MKRNKIQDIINLDNVFYEKIAQEFSVTRQGSWNGWKKVIKVIKHKLENGEKMQVLDIGSGNGRFFKFLQENINGFEYTGLEINEYLITESRQNYPTAKFEKLDVLSEINKINKKYDAVVIFGLTHHIPGKIFRKQWFSFLARLLKNDGLLIFTIWRFSEDKRFISRAKVAEDLEQNDYYYDWANSKHKRYFHKYSEMELETLIEKLQLQNLKLIDKFDCDGKTNRLNRYYIFKKIT